MAKLEIDLVDIKTQDENHLREDTKWEILYDNTVVENNVPKLMKSGNENDHFDVEGEVIKTEMKCERSNDSESDKRDKIR